MGFRHPAGFGIIFVLQPPFLLYRVDCTSMSGIAARSLRGLAAGRSMNRSILESVYTLPSSTRQKLLPSVYNFSSGAGAVMENVPTTSTTGTDTKKVIADLLPVLPNPPIPPAPMVDGEMLRPRSTWQNLSDKYSLSGQQNKIQRGETLFQAARRQASDP